VRQCGGGAAHGFGPEMRDLKSAKVMALKTALFALLVALSTAGIILRAPELRTGILVAVLIWSAARLYYFLFYVLQTYVDPSFRYAGLLSLVRHATSRWRFRRAK